MFINSFSYTRKFTHDPRIYSKPDEFRPERFLAAENGGIAERDPRDLCFGFGRRSVRVEFIKYPLLKILHRVCPGGYSLMVVMLAASHMHLGIHFADASVFIMCAMSLAALDVEKQVIDGIAIEPLLEYSTGTIR